MVGTRLSERAILAAATELTRRHGVKGLTMRTLAEALGVSPMATYHYVSSRDELLLLVADEVMRPVQPPPPGASWDERLWAFMTEMGDALAALPGLADFLLQNDLTGESRRYMRQCIALIRDGGFDEREARQAFVAIYTYMWGSYLFLAVRNSRVTTRGRRRAGQVPSADELASRPNLEVGYRALVAGLEQTVRGS